MDPILNMYVFVQFYKGIKNQSSIFDASCSRNVNEVGVVGSAT